MSPPRSLTRVASALEPRAPRFVDLARRAGDQALDWRDSWRHRHHPDPGMPWTARYRRHQRRLVEQALTDTTLLQAFEPGSAPPRGYGIGLDERVVEYPWTLARRPAGRVLDAGSTLNWSHVLGHFLPAMDQLHIVTLEPGAPAVDADAVSYVHADLRELPFRDGWFDTVVCLSTLEHVGMDNSRWGVDAADASDPGIERRQAMAELRRVTAPNGRILVTVPYGRPERHGWFEQYDRAALQDLAEALGSETPMVTVYRYTTDGWRLSDLEDAADARYRDADRGADDELAAAGAVACLELRPERPI